LVVKNGSKTFAATSGRHTDPVSASANTTVVARAHVGVLRGVGFIEMHQLDSHREAASARHGVARIDGQIEESTLELSRVRNETGDLGEGAR